MDNFFSSPGSSNMADGSVLCDLSSSGFLNFNVPDSSELCLNSEALKCELLKTQDELKSTWLIIELLVNEVNASVTERS
jgi:hypothetical protein